MPGDPIESLIARLQSGGGSQEMDSQALIESFRAKYGLDQPLITQYVNYWGDLARFDLGVSLSSYPQTVSQMILQALPWSVGLLTVATLIAFAVGSVLGARLAWPRSGRLIRTLVPGLMVLASIPFYLLAIILIYLFAVAWRLFPPAGGVEPDAHHALRPRERARHRPPRDPARARHRARQRRALGARHAQPDGLGARRGLHHLRRGEGAVAAPDLLSATACATRCLPQVTALALSLGHVVSGAVLVEVIFNYPGLGALLYSAVRGQDYFVVQGVVLMLILTLAVLLFIIDLIYPLLDPRIRR